MKQNVELWICPDCGAEVEVGARGCPRCLEAERRGRRPAVPRRPWEQDEAHDGLDLPDEEFDYRRFVAREFGGRPHQRVGIAWHWWLTALALVGLLAWAFMAGRW